MLCSSRREAKRFKIKSRTHCGDAFYVWQSQSLTHDLRLSSVAHSNAWWCPSEGSIESVAHFFHQSAVLLWKTGLSVHCHVCSSPKLNCKLYRWPLCSTSLWNVSLYGIRWLDSGSWDLCYVMWIMLSAGEREPMNLP